MADRKKTTHAADAPKATTETPAEARARALAQSREDAHAAVDERHDRAEALASVPQKVVDANEAAALLTITGQAPLRDTSDAPAPGLLGPHSETVNPVDDPADVDTSVAGTEDAAA